MIPALGMVNRSPKTSSVNLIWLLAYFVLIGLIIGGALYGRRQALEVYGSKQAQSEWDEWREDANRMAQQPSPVKRRAPRSVQPPALVLMRDYFGVCLTI